MYSRFSRTALTLALTVALATTTAFAATPETVSYQGRLTDAGGAPLTGVYSITFSIYELSAGGPVEWSEVHPAVNVDDGLFSVALGSIVPLTDNVFSWYDRYLGIKVGADPEITPRTKFHSVAYANRVSTIGGSSGGQVTGEVSVLANTTGGAVTATQLGSGVAGKFQGSVETTGDMTTFDGLDTAVFVDASTSQIRTYGSDGLEQIRIWGQSWAEILLRDQTNNDLTAVLSATSNSGGNLKLNDELGVTWIELDGGASGDATVMFPNDAVNTDEILDEVGVTNRLQGSSMILTGSDSTIALRTINAPTNGYVLAIGTVHINTIHTVGNQDHVRLTIKPTAGGSGFSIDYRVGTGSASANWETPVTIHGMFSVSAGANQFTFNIRALMGNSNIASLGQFTLIFIPTLYGPLTSNDQPAPPTGYQSPEDELRASQEFNIQRIEDEMAALRAQLDALSEKVESQENE